MRRWVRVNEIVIRVSVIFTAFASYLTCTRHLLRRHKVEGRGGVAKIEACSRSLPQTTLRVVVVRAPGGLEEELAAVADSELWAEDPRGTIIIAAVPEVMNCDSCDNSGG